MATFQETVQGSFGGLPVVERNSTYIAYFQSIGGTGPEIINQSAYFISYLIDEKGNISNPLSEPSSLENLYQNFEIGKNSIASLELPSTNNSQLNGEHKITGIGTIQPIIYTETGSNVPDYVTTMSFQWYVSPDSSLGIINQFAGQVTKNTIEGNYFWTTGSVYTNGYTWLTSSEDLNAFLSDNFKQIPPTSSLNFSPIVKPSSILPGDIFRFEYNKNQLYIVTEIEPPPTGLSQYPLILKVTPSLPTSSIDLNHFVLYRLVRNGKYIILDVDKNSGNTSGGILRPKYLPKSFEDNYDNVLDILRDKGILKDSLSLDDITE
jgi:hypothetical protein